MTQPEIFTIGHSTHTIDKFVDMLQSFEIGLIVDIRLYPGSKRYPHFNSEALEKSLEEHKIGYRHFPDLGGRRRPAKDSPNTAWRVEAFRGYADYMESDAFRKAINELQDLARSKKTAYMCSEAVWWSCHRSLVSDYLKAEGWKVMHIMNTGKAEEHPYTKPAKIVNGRLSYKETDLFS